MNKAFRLPDIYEYVVDHPIATAEGIDKALKHLNQPFHWCKLTPHQERSVYWHVRGYSARRIGERMGLTRDTIRKHLERAVEKINEAEDWEITIRDLADVLLKLIEEELDGNTNEK